MSKITITRLIVSLSQQQSQARHSINRTHVVVKALFEATRGQMSEETATFLDEMLKENEQTIDEANTQFSRHLDMLEAYVNSVEDQSDGGN